MATSTQKAARARHFDSPLQEAYLGLWRTYDRLRLLEDELFGQYELTAQQYNALRLLCAERPRPMPTLTLAARLVSRAPDITRMVDRLEKRGLVTRERSAEDRRAVLVAITPEGTALLDALARPLRQCHERQLGHLSERELAQLINLLRRAREPHELPDSPWH